MRIAPLTLAVFSIASGAVAAADTWRTFRDPDGVFSFDAPGPIHALNASRAASNGVPVHVTLYEYGTNAAGQLSWEQLSCGVAKTSFGNSRSLAPKAVADIAAETRSVLTAGGVKADFDAEARLNGYVGWRMEYRDGKKNRLWFRWFVVKNQLLQFACSIPPTATSSEIAAANRMAASFNILAR